MEIILPSGEKRPLDSPGPVVSWRSLLLPSSFVDPSGTIQRWLVLVFFSSAYVGDGEHDPLTGRGDFGVGDAVHGLEVGESHGALLRGLGGEGGGGEGKEGGEAHGGSLRCFCHRKNSRFLRCAAE